MDAPALAAITLDPTGGGVAVVSQLLWRVIEEQWGTRAHLLTMFDHASRPATLVEKTRFTVTLTSAEVFGRTDWILFSHLGLAQIQNMIPSRLRRPYAVYLHGIEVWKPLSVSEQRALIGADLRLANSRYTADRAADIHPGIGPIEVCPLALPPVGGASASASGEPAIAWLGSHAVLVVGRMIRSERYKGHDQVIDAWPQVVARIPDARLVIVGEGDDRERLKKKAAASPAAGTIVFTGFVQKPMLEALYERAALFALPSRGEGFGLVYLEAMAHRLPCVGSIHDAAREVIVDGQTGRLVDQRNVDALADTLAMLLADESQRRRLGEAGRARVLNEFSFERFRDRVYELLHVEHRPEAVGVSA